MQHYSNDAAAADWLLLALSDSESERLVSLHGDSRPATPALPRSSSECSTPESERLANTVLGAPLPPQPSLTSYTHSTGQLPHDHASDALAENEELVGMHCLQLLSQEGSLDGFTTPRTMTPMQASATVAAVSQFTSDSATARPSTSVLAGLASDLDPAVSADDSAHVAAEGEDGEGWGGMQAGHLSAIADLDIGALLMHGLSWGGACIAGLAREVQSEITGLLTLLPGTSLDTTLDSAPLTESLMGSTPVSTWDALRVTLGIAQRQQQLVTDNSSSTQEQQQQVVNRPLTAWALSNPRAARTVVAALGASTLAALAGLAYYMTKCNSLSAVVEARDRELTRALVKLINIQDVLERAPRGLGAVLRTSHHHMTSHGPYLALTL